MFKRILNLVYEILIGFTVALVLFLTFSFAWIYYQDSLPISTVFIAKLEIPDTNKGIDIPIVHDRTVYQSFVADYSVEVKTAIDSKTVCFANGYGIKYDVGEPTPKRTLFQYTGGNCVAGLDPGQYYVQTTWSIHLLGHRNRYLTITSNIFNILPPNSATPTTPPSQQLLNGVQKSDLTTNGLSDNEKAAINFHLTDPPE